MTTSPSEVNDENKKQLEDWDPEKAKVVGTLKAPIEFATTPPEVKVDVEFGEPKPAKIVNKKSKKVDIGKRNKNSLF